MLLRHGVAGNIIIDTMCITSSMTTISSTLMIIIVVITKHIYIYIYIVLQAAAVGRDAQRLHKHLEDLDRLLAALRARASGVHTCVYIYIYIYIYIYMMPPPSRLKDAQACL